MTEATIVTITMAVIAAIPPTLVALAGLQQGKRNGVKADQIHTLANSNLTKVTDDLAAANAQIKDLQVVVRKLMGLPPEEEKKDA